MAGLIKRRMLKDKDKLIEMYHQKGLSLTDISNKYGCSRQYVQMVFIDLGIERRSRREALRMSPKKRKSKFDFKPKHDSYISRNYDRMTDHEIARALKKPVNAVTYRRLIVLGKKKVERKNFTPDENNFILKNYRNLTDVAIAHKLDRSLISITHHRNRILNRPKRHVRSYTEKEDKYIRQNYKSLTDGELAGVLKRSKASVAIHRHEVLGLEKQARRKRKGKSKRR